MGLFGFLFNRKSKSADGLPISNESVVELSEDVKVSDEKPKQLNLKEDHTRNLYQRPEKLVDIEFFNRTNTLTNIWIEPTCVSIDLDSNTEYKIVTHDRSFRMEFDKNNQVVFYLQYSFGFKLYKRPESSEVINRNKWVLDYDSSDIN